MRREGNKYVGLVGIIAILLLGSGIWYVGFENNKTGHVAEGSHKLDPIEKKKARSDYFFNLLRDPATNSIPANIRSRELNHAKQLRGGRSLQKTGTETMQQIGDISWNMAGPEDLGGRTRALAFDQSDPNYETILAGGVSGGMWKSTDGGNTWQMKTDPNQNLSVTSVAQDPSDHDIWYYSSGEYYGNSASDRGNRANYSGSGIYKSTDGGENWSVLPVTESDPITFDSQFDYVSAIDVAPDGKVFVASNPFGLLRSEDEGSSFDLVLGGTNEHAWTDFDIDSNGNIIAVISSTGFSSPSNDPGIYYSTDDGDSWNDITPTDFPSSHDRSVITFAPSDPNIAYVFSNKDGSTTNQGISFFKLNLNDDSAEDRSENIPDFGESVGGMNLQGGYNMVVGVKPDDPDVVFVGGTNLFRSRDGFATTPSGGYNNSDTEQKEEYWVGGYARANNVSQYPNQHPDQHVLAFHPDDPNIMWSGHDGGLSKTTDVTAAPLNWEDTDEGYVTGQFYTVEISNESGDDRYLGGTQDNGTPFFRFDESNTQTTAMKDVSSGDGSYAHWGANYAYVSSQNGNVLRLPIQSDGSIESPFTTGVGSYVNPDNASNQLFVHPYAVDPNDEGVMYYPGGTTMWRNTSVDGNDPGSSWDDFEGTSSTGYTISTLEVTSVSPSDRLYYGASSSSGTPELFRLDNASSSDTPTEISISNMTVDEHGGAYLHDIAVNPNDGDEIVAVMSNYNITGLYHSTDAGDSWTAIEGNLEGDSQNPGPSLRSAEILPTEEGNIYLVGTSTGIYKTMALDGNSTNWERESDDGSAGSIGYSVVEYLDVRASDGTIAVGTHGRGIFVGRTDVGDVVVDQLPVIEDTLEVNDNWQLVGSPMAADSDAEPGYGLQLYEFSGTYKSVANLTSHNGYWAKSRSGSEVTYNGEADTSATIALEEGWNLMGGLADTVDVSAINDPDGILSSADVFEFTDGSYQSASDIKSFKGYWIHANEAGDIEILPESSSNKSGPVLASESVGKLTFSNGVGKQQFYVSMESLNASEREKYLMPPMAPEADLDVRTTQNLRLADGDKSELELTTNSYPVTISSHLQNSQNYSLQGVSGQDTVYYDLKADGKVTLQHPHESLFLKTTAGGPQITEHHLMPNYPNPFNPETQIRYQVASQSQVTLDVYDVLGRKVRTLVDEQKSRGDYTVRFDGSNLSSGMYFIHLKAGETIRLQKMTLIK